MRFLASVAFLLGAAAATAAWDAPEPLLIIEAETTDVLWQDVADALWVDGRLVIADYSLNRAVVFGPEPGRASVLADTGEGPGLTQEPMGVARDPDGNVVVVSSPLGKCDVFGPDGELVRSYRLYSPEGHAFCNVISAEWRGDECFAYSFRIAMREGRLDTDYVIERLGPAGADTTLYRTTWVDPQRRLDETQLPPFQEHGWLAAPDGGLWCPLDRTRAAVTDLLTGRVAEVRGLEPCPVPPDSVAARRERIAAGGRYEEIRLLETIDMVDTVLWDDGLALLCRVAGDGEGGRMVVAYPGEDGRVEPFTPPVPDASGALFLAGPRIFAAHYKEEGTFVTAWGEEVRGPCIIVARYGE